MVLQKINEFVREKPWGKKHTYMAVVKILLPLEKKEGMPYISDDAHIHTYISRKQLICSKR